MPIKFPFGWGRTSADGATTPAPATPYDPTHVWVSTPAGDVLTNTATGQTVTNAVPTTPIVVAAPVARTVINVPGLSIDVPAANLVSAPVSAIPTSIATPVAKEPTVSIFSVLKSDSAKLVSVMEAIGKDADKGLVVVAKYLPETAAVAELLFPAEAPEIAAGTSVALNVTNLIQTSVAEVEAKAKLIPAGLTGAQKSADVLQIVEQSVIADLTTLKVPNPTTSYVQSLVNAICAILNIPSTTAVAA